MNQQTSATLLDEYISKFQNMPPWNIHSITEDGHDSNPWFEVKGDAVVKELVINELDLYRQVTTITAEIQKWGRLAAMCQRSWEIWERNYRRWRSQYYLDMIDPEEKEEGWKKPTKEKIEALYRTDPVYHDFQRKIERAQEAHTATEAVLSAYRAKKDMLMRFAYRHSDDGQPRLSV